MNKAVLEKIKNIREIKNLTQEYMAEQLGITQAGYSKIENGTTLLTLKKLIEIAKILVVDVEDILRFDIQNYFNNKNSVRGNNSGRMVINTETDGTSDTVKELYEDKIILLEKLLANTEDELARYKRKYGEL